MSDTELIQRGNHRLGDYENIAYVESYGLVYPLTPCCQASAKGTEYGTACRACYAEIDPVFGICWTTAEFEERINK